VNEDAIPPQPDGIFHFGKVPFKIRTYGGNGEARADGLGRGLYVSYDTIDTIRPAMEVVIAGLEADILKNKETGCHANGQSHDIDKRKDPVVEEVADGDLKIILYHTLFVAKGVPLLQRIVNQKVVESLSGRVVRIRYIFCTLSAIRSIEVNFVYLFHAIFRIQEITPF
jgi:hypothetical protein